MLIIFLIQLLQSLYVTYGGHDLLPVFFMVKIFTLLAVAYAIVTYTNLLRFQTMWCIVFIASILFSLDSIAPFYFPDLQFVHFGLTAVIGAMNISILLKTRA